MYRFWVGQTRRVGRVHDQKSVYLAGGLVGEQERRTAGERAGDRDALLLATGQLCRETHGRTQVTWIG